MQRPPYGPLQTTSWVHPPVPPPVPNHQVPPTVPVETKTPVPAPRWYINDNVHTYTHYWRDQLPTLLPQIAQYGSQVPPETWAALIPEIADKYQQHPLILATLGNINQYYRPDQGSILNPELPGLNSAVVLAALWTKLKHLNEPSLFAHFQETLFGIGQTCLAGITDRLLADFFVLHDEKLKPEK